MNQDYKQLLTEVIKKQIVILGPDITLSKARNVKGLTVANDGTVTAVAGNQQEVIQALIDQFVQLSGLIVKKTMEPLLSISANQTTTDVIPAQAGIQETSGSRVEPGMTKSEITSSTPSPRNDAAGVVPTTQSTPVSTEAPVQPPVQSPAPVVSPEPVAPSAPSAPAGPEDNTQVPGSPIKSGMTDTQDGPQIPDAAQIIQQAETASVKPAQPPVEAAPAQPMPPPVPAQTAQTTTPHQDDAGPAATGSQEQLQPAKNPLAA